VTTTDERSSPLFWPIKRTLNGTSPPYFYSCMSAVFCILNDLVLHT
jgi:hypothetical protein